MTDPRDEPRDAHLQAALRHAPDRDAGPSAALSARILQQARQATATAPAGAGWFDRWFGWMSQPVAAGALGTVLIAGFVGLMWRDGPPPEALPGSDTPTAAPPMASPPPVPAPVAATAPSPEAASPTAHAPASPAPAMPPAAAVADGVAPPGDARRRAPAAVPEVSAEARREAAPPAAAKVAEPPAPRAAEQNSAGPVAPPALPSQGPSPAPAPLTAVPAAPPTAVPAAAPPQAPAPAAPPVGTTQQTRGRSVGAAAPAAARLAGAPVDPLAAALAALSSPADTTWRDRLASLLGRTQGRWTPTDAVPPDTAEPVVDSTGRVLGWLHVDAARVLWQGADGRTWQAPLPAPPSAFPAASPAAR